MKSRKPVRVIRGFKCPSAFAPEYGYRYDGKSAGYLSQSDILAGTFSNFAQPECARIHMNKVVK